jgi:hypothetical protein
MGIKIENNPLKSGSDPGNFIAQGILLILFAPFLLQYDSQNGDPISPGKIIFGIATAILFIGIGVYKIRQHRRNKRILENKPNSLDINDMIRELRIKGGKS